ncbi:alpha/beta fold hydrolase [Nocardioides immobilis]|nr:alpha/beta hydrolase [Nocardioides immobilis]
MSGDLAAQGVLPTLVLVHGSWHGPWAWESLQLELSARGVTSVAVTLPGKGRKSGAPDFEGHCRELAALLDGLDGPSVLVGHSYGGVVVTQVGLRPQIHGLVYIAGFNLREGETISSVVDSANGSQSGADSLATDDDGFLLIDPATAVASFYNDCPTNVAEAAAARLTPEHPSSRTSTVTQVGWRSVPSLYVACSLDQALPPAQQEMLARRATARAELASSHSPMLSMPSELADVLVDALDLFSSGPMRSPAQTTPGTSGESGA